MPKKILLADDSITIQKVIGLTFANEDVQLTVVDNGDEAIIKAKEVIPDLIIADVVMPGKDGYEVCYSSKNEPSLAHVPVLLLTGTFETFDETMATKVGADGFITKPFESQALIDKVNELIGNAEQRRSGLSAADLQADSGGLDTGMDAGFDAGAELLDTVEPLEAIDDITPLEDIAPVDDLAPMELDELPAVEPVAEAPVEEDPMAGFDHLTPDPEETSFADVSFEDAPAEQPVSHDDLLAVGDEEPADLAAEIPSQELSTPAPEAVQAAPAGEDGGWNLSEFNDYMSEKSAPRADAPSAELTEVAAVPEAEVAPVEEDLPAPVEEFASVETGYDLTTSADEMAPLAAEEDLATPAEETTQLSADADLSAPAEKLSPLDDTLSSAPSATIEEPVAQTDSFEDASAFGAADSFSAEEPLTEEIGAPADEFTTTAFGSADDDLPVVADEQTDSFTTETFSDEPVAMEETMAAEEPVAEQPEAADDFLPIADEPAPVQARPAMAAIELSPDDGEMELTPVAPQPDLPLEQVAEMYPLDEAPAEIEPAADDLIAEEAAVEPPMNAELADEEPVEPPTPAFPTVAAPAAPAAAAFDTAALEQQLGRLPELIEGRVKSMLENDALLTSLGDKTSKLVEAKIEEAIRKVAPEMIEQLVKKALADATERILNETIGRLRNG
jgi:CheY-like chemotaxis protein